MNNTGHDHYEGSVAEGCVVGVIAGSLIWVAIGYLLWRWAR